MRDALRATRTRRWFPGWGALPPTASALPGFFFFLPLELVRGQENEAHKSRVYLPAKAWGDQAPVPTPSHGPRLSRKVFPENDLSAATGLGHVFTTRPSLGPGPTSPAK